MNIPMKNAVFVFAWQSMGLKYSVSTWHWHGNESRASLVDAIVCTRRSNETASPSTAAQAIPYGIAIKNIADSLGIARQDITNVIRGRSKSPRYIAEVYKFLGLKMPEEGYNE